MEKNKKDPSGLLSYTFRLLFEPYWSVGNESKP
jgi:hypothetical protein